MSVINIAGRLHSVATGNTVAGADEILDDAKGKKQSVVNAEVDAALADRYTKEETYSKEETYNKTQLDSLITTPDQQWVTEEATEETTDVTDVLPATGAADTIYRVAFWDGTQYDDTAYSMYAWDGTQYVLLAVRTLDADTAVFNVTEYNAGTTYASASTAANAVPAGYRKPGLLITFQETTTGDWLNYQFTSDDPTNDWLTAFAWIAPLAYQLGVFDISAYHATGGTLATYADLAAALGTNGANVPAAYRRGGMTVKFVKSSDNKYVQYRLMSDTFNTTPANWQGVDEEPTAGSGNMVKSGGVAEGIISKGIVPVSVLRYSNITSYLSDGQYGFSLYLKQFAHNVGGEVSSIDAPDLSKFTFNGNLYEIRNARLYLYANIVEVDIISNDRDTVKNYLEQNKFGYINGSGLMLKLDGVNATTLLNSNFIVKYNESFYIANSDKILIEIENYNQYKNIVQQSLYKKTFSIDTSGIVDYYLQENSTYVIFNTGSYPFNIFVSDGVNNVERVGTSSLQPGDSISYTPSDTYYYIKFVGFSSDITLGIEIKRTDTIGKQIEDLEHYDASKKPLLNLSTDIDAYGAETLPYYFKKGGHYKVTNKCEYNLSVYSNDGTSNIDRAGTSFIEPNASAVLTATQDAAYIRIVQSAAGEWHNLTIEIEDALSNYALFDNILDVKEELNPQTKIFTGTYNNFPYKFTKGKTYYIRNISSNDARVYSNDGTDNVEAVSFAPLAPNDYVLFVPSISADYIRLAGSNVEKTVLVTETLLTDKAYNYLDNIIHNVPLASFDYGHIAQDLSDDLVDDVLPVNKLNETEEWSVYPDIVISQFDALVTNHPNDIEKIDLGTYCNIAYPSYASLNGVASGGYLATPTYKMWMYKISSWSTANGYATKKKTLLITAGIHGWEMIGSNSAYHFAKQMLDDYLDNDTMFKFRSAFDIYIVPLVNGYGNYHLTRQNANGVNLNRNFYVGESHTDLHPFDFDYPGETGLSEFESQIINKLGNTINPDLVLDLHTNASYPFYTELFVNNYEKDLLRASYKSLTDVSYFCEKLYGAYFGSNFKILQNNAAPTFVSSTPGTLAGWFTTDNVNKKLPYSAILEVSNCLNYQNGSFIPISQSGIRTYKIEAITIAEYVIRNQILRYAEYLLNISN